MPADLAHGALCRDVHVNALGCLDAGMSHQSLAQTVRMERRSLRQHSGSAGAFVVSILVVVDGTQKQ